MRSHAKATTAGSTKRLGKKSKPALLLCVLAAAVASLALVVGSASGATTRFLVEAFGSSAQPTFPGDRGMAVDQATGELYVLETNTDEIRRYNGNGTPSNFGALGSNAIDGEGTGDETPDLGLAIAGSRSESQIAIDESGGATDGNIYVTESSRDQVSIFSSSGEYLGELSEHSGGAFSEPLGVAVDPSGNVYVGDFSSEDLIHKYEPAANPPVNADNSASFNSLAGTSSIGTLAAGAGATAGFIFVNRFNGELFKLDATTGEVKYQLTTSASTVYVDPLTGHVFVPRLTGTESEVVEYDASGAAEATKVSAFKPGSTAEGVAVANSGEQVYVSLAGTENVEVFGPAAVIPDVVTEAPSSNTGVRATLAGTVNPDGVELDECFFEWGRATFQGGEGTAENTTPCAETPAEIGAGTSPAPAHADIDGLIPQGATYQYRLVAVNPNGTVNGQNQNFTTPDTVITQAASGTAPTEVTLNGTVNPDGTAITECIFEWGPEKEPFEEFQPYPETAPCVPGPGGIGAGTSPVAVSAELTGLHPGSRYAYRLKAANANGSILGDQLIAQTTGPMILAAWVENVVYTEAILKAEIDPEGSATTYRFEYGTTTAYGQETPELSVGSDSLVHEVSRVLEDLQPGTTYHYRVVATNAVGANEGPDRTFTTYRTAALDTACPNQIYRIGPAAQLPDCRAYEMVSPIDKSNGDIAWLPEGFGWNSAYNQSAVNGEKVTYSSYKAFGDTVSDPYTSQYISTRHEGEGWSTHSINPPERKGAVIGLGFVGREYRAFSPDLSTGWLLPESGPSLAPGAAEGYINIYKRNNLTDSYEALTKGAREANFHTATQIGFQGSSADGSHAIFTANESWSPEAPPIAENDHHLYEWVNGQLRLVSILPNGEPSSGSSAAGRPQFGGPYTSREPILDNAISDDGSHIFWTKEDKFQSGAIYVRIDGTETVPVSESVTSAPSVFWTASADGSKALFSVGEDGPGELYEFNVDTETPTLIAHDALGVAGAGDDMSYIYFTSKEALDGGATAGQSNLYVYHEGSSTFIATLTGGDANPGFAPSISNAKPSERNTKVTPDGHHLLFMSNARLTGYDNTDAKTGNPASEVYRYDANDEKLTCVSCNPTGARPSGSQEMPWGPNTSYVNTEVAAWIPPWESPLYTIRSITDDGNRVFFNSFDSLVPQDANGAQDVYQWESPGTGSCSDTSPSYSARAEGCISLISSGESPDFSEFVDASANGKDVFFRTKSSLLPHDPGLFDLYDARAGGGVPAPPAPPTPCIGDACQDASEAPHDPTPSSAVFSGPGNPNSARTRSCSRSSRAALKLSRRAIHLRRAAKRVARNAHKARGAKRTYRKTRQAKRMYRKAGTLANRARKLKRINAKRCRRANGGARR